MKRAFVFFLNLLVVTSMSMAQREDIGKVKLLLWTKEGEEGKAFQFVQKLAQDYTRSDPDITFEVVNKGIETMREDFQTASLAGEGPDLLWTVSDHVGPFHVADLIQPVDNLFDLSRFVESTFEGMRADGKTWGIPIYNGNHLMLLYNKTLVSKPPTTTDELFAMAGKFKSGVYPLVWDQTEPFWLVPWLGAFKGKVFAADGKTPTLDTPEMVKSLQLFYDVKYKYKLIPAESNIDTAEALFKEGKAAMIIDGDWSLSGFLDVLKEGLGIARLPKLSATGEWPRPYTNAVFFMFPKYLKGSKLKAAQRFVNFVTITDRQLQIVKTLHRLPATQYASEDPLIANDPILKASVDQMMLGTPMPTALEMRCVWDSMRPEMQAVLANKKTPKDAAAAMQKSTIACIRSQE